MCLSLRRATAVVVVSLALLSCESAIQPEPELSVSVIGQGRITSSPFGIDCTAGQSESCSSAFPAGTAVTLTMTAEGGWEFGGWSGACAGADGCVVTLDVSAAVSATFIAQPVLTVTIVGGGRVISSPVGIDCRTDQNGTCSAPFPGGTAVTLTSGGGGEFSAWGGACSGAGQCVVTLDGSVAVSATFFFRWALIGAGNYGACGLTTTGTAYCWGIRPPAFERFVPIQIEGGITLDTLAVGDFHQCGITSTAKAYCWGHNEYGQLGDGTYTDRTEPVPVLGDLSFSSISAGGNYTCGLTTLGAAYCWGRNDFGELGIGTNDTFTPGRGQTTPEASTGGLRFAALTAAGQTCALTEGGTAYCWGINWFGEVGIGTTTAILEPGPTNPALVLGDLTFVGIAAGAGHTCARTFTGMAYCWGANWQGQLGVARVDPFPGAGALSPVPVMGGLSFTTVVTGSQHTCGLDADGLAYCWGHNHEGQLGNGSTADGLIPIEVAGALKFAALSAGTALTCGVTSGGQGYCWGWNAFGGVGDGSTTSRSEPVLVADPG